MVAAIALIVLVLFLLLLLLCLHSHTRTRPQLASATGCVQVCSQLEGLNRPPYREKISIIHYNLGGCTVLVISLKQ